jgi:hypothetical protein
VQGLGAKVVQELSVHVAENSCIFADNYFTSPDLVQSLLQSNIRYVGTVRSNRKNFPTDVVIKPKKDTPRGEIKMATCANTKVTVACWYDNKPVSVMGSAFSPVATQTAQRRGRDAAGFNRPMTIPQPEIIHKYNAYMGGVDQMDQLRAVYPFERTIKSALWYKKLYMGLFGIALNNA